MKDYGRFYSYEHLKKKASEGELWNPEGFKSKNFLVRLHQNADGGITVISKQVIAKVPIVQVEVVRPGQSLGMLGRYLNGKIDKEILSI